jgi:hypothetical protein
LENIMDLAFLHVARQFADRLEKEARVELHSILSDLETEAQNVDKHIAWLVSRGHTVTKDDGVVVSGVANPDTSTIAVVSAPVAPAPIVPAPAEPVAETPAPAEAAPVAAVTETAPVVTETAPVVAENTAPVAEAAAVATETATAVATPSQN